MKLYFLGGENIIKRSGRNINVSAFLDAGGAPSVLVLPWARASFDRTYRRKKQVFDYFRSLGACSVEFVDYSAPTEEISRKIRDSDLLYLTGGLPTALVKRLRNRGVDLMLRRYDRVVVGRSAGALALCKKCITTDRNKKAAMVIDGLGLVDITLKVHYKSSKDAELRRMSKKDRIFAIPSGSALVYDSGALSTMGDVYLFQDGEKTAVEFPLTLG
ncbi:MAG: Type 1 glutamine amidotransferase-like domain-containing protein [Candidatus Bathyarchaeota archaeon]|nr:Type 1 glutamine amidotransferase-like domain-containing protein [Candidatus Bathyarchaeota archaeon]